MGHLIRRNSEQTRRVLFVFAGGVRSHLRLFLLARTQNSASQAQLRRPRRSRPTAFDAIDRVSNAIMATPLFPRLDASVPVPSCNSPMLDDKRVDSSGKFARHRENPAGLRLRVCSILGDVARLLRLIHIAVLIELDNFVVGLQRGESIDDVGVHLLGGLDRFLFSLGDRKTGLGDFSLIAVKNGEIDVEEEGAAVDAGSVGVVETYA